MNGSKITAGAAFIAGFAISIASIVFMAFVFFNESILGHGVLYIEPNRYLAFGELAACGYGMFFAVFMLKTFLSSENEDHRDGQAKALSVANGAVGKDEKTGEPDGYARNGRMYG